MEGRVVGQIRVSGLRNVPSDVVERHLVTRVGAPFRRAALAADQRRLDELRLFTAVLIEPRLEADAVVLDVAVTETLRLLPIVFIRVTDENGVSAGPGPARHQPPRAAARRRVWPPGSAARPACRATVDATTITPGTWCTASRIQLLQSRATRSTTSTSAPPRPTRASPATGATACGPAWRPTSCRSTPATPARRSPRMARTSFPRSARSSRSTGPDSSTNPRDGWWAEAEIDRLFGDAGSWTFILDGRRFQRLADRHGLGIFALATLQTGEVGTSLPEYLQFALGGANTVRGWSLGARTARNQFIGTLEYTYVLQPVRSFSVAGLNLYWGLQLAGFGDLGLAWNDWDDLTGSPALDGYGAGLRVQVPFVDLIQARRGVGRTGTGRDRLFRRVAQGRPAAPAGALTVTPPLDRRAPVAVRHQPSRPRLHARC